MKLIKFTSSNLDSIAAEMGNGVSFEELTEMLNEDYIKDRPRYFLIVDDLWAFVEERTLEPLLYATLKLLHA